MLALTSVLPKQVEALAAEDGICDRTQQVQDAIVAAVADVDDCADITATHLAQVTGLSLYADNIRTLQAGDFAGLSALDSLNLAFNHLRTLPSGIFDGLTSLEFLQLGGNDLIQLPDSVFTGLTSLVTLGLGDNVGYPFGPTGHAGPTNNVGTDARVTLQGRRVGDPWGREVTFAWTQSDETGETVPLEDANTATPSLTAPAVEEEIRLGFQLAVTAVNPGGVAPPGTTTAGDTGLDTAYVFVGPAEPVIVSFVSRSHTATEGGTAATVGIRLNKIAKRTLSIPLKAIPADGADAGDYTVPKKVTFGFADKVKYVTVTATDDDVDDDGEGLTLQFGSPLPIAVTAGTPATIDVALEDNDDPEGVSITDLAVTSDPGDDATYKTGDVIEVTATFEDTVTVSGQPQLILSVGTHITELLGQAARNAGYDSGSGTENLVFAYRVTDGDSDPDGVSAKAGSLLLNGGAIQVGSGVDALLVHDGMEAQPGHKVDALPPELSEAFVNGPKLTVRYTEPLDEGSVPAASAFRVQVDGVGRTVSTVGIDDKLVTLTLASAVEPGEEVTASYTAPADDPIRDRAGLAAESFTSESVTNYSDPGVRIEAIDPAVYEGEDIDFRLFRNGPADRSVQVTVDVEDDGDVLLGTEGSKRVSFAAGDSTAFLTLETHDDHGYEPHATVTATVVEGGNYAVSETHGSASVTVSDNDLPEMFVTLAAPDSVGENVGRFTVRVEASTVSDEEPHGGLSVRLGSADGTATSGSGGDFAAVDEVIRFLPDDYRRVVTEGVARYVATREHLVTIHNDGIEEEDEAFELELTRSYVIGDRVTLPADPHVVTIVDNDDAENPGIRVTPILLFMNEGESERYRVALRSQPLDTVTVTVGGWSGTDVTVAPASLDFTPSNWNVERTVTVTAEQDEETDNDEVTLTHRVGDGDADAGATVEITVADDDVPTPRLSLRALTDSVKEGDFAIFEVTRTGPLDRTLLAGIIVWDLFEYEADDWVAVYFREGEEKDTVGYSVKIDTLVTTDRTLRAAINPYLDGYEVGSPSEVEINVIDATAGDAGAGIGVSLDAMPQVAEEGGEGVAVTVRLTRPADDAVTIPLVARGIGGAGEGDWDVPSEVLIEAGELEGTVEVAAVDDDEPDPGESFALSVGMLPRGYVAQDPRQTIVTIDDNDHFRMGMRETRGWLARFGRAATDEAAGAVRERMTAAQRSSAGSRFTFGAHDPGALRDAAFTTSLDAANQWSVWGRGGVSGFGGRDGVLSLSGDMTTVTLGADYGTGRALGGVVLSRYLADGTLIPGDGPSGRVETTLSAAYPWLRVALTDRIAVWGMGGYGIGSIPGTLDGGDAGGDVAMRMGAAGATGNFIATRALTLALSSDAALTRTSLDGANASEDVTAEVSRVRVMIEGSMSLRVAAGTFRPALEVGFRQDGGDAERGKGIALGGGFGYAHPRLRINVEARAQGLIAHQDGAYEEWGASGSVRISPDPSGRGLNLDLSPFWGGTAHGGARALWSRRDMTGISIGDGSAARDGGGRLALDLGYGVALSERFVATPYAGTMNDTRRLGLRLRTGSIIDVAFERMNRNGRGTLLLNAGYRPRPLFDLTLQAGRDVAGEIRLGLQGNAGW